MKEVVRANELEDRTHGARSYPYGRERNGSLSHRCPGGSLSCSLSVMQLVCALIQRKATRLLGPTWFPGFDPNVRKLKKCHVNATLRPLPPQKWHAQQQIVPGRVKKIRHGDRIGQQRKTPASTKPAGATL